MDYIYEFYTILLIYIFVKVEHMSAIYPKLILKILLYVIDPSTIYELDIYPLRFENYKYEEISDNYIYYVSMTPVDEFV